VTGNADILGLPPLSGGNAPLAGPGMRNFRQKIRRKALRLIRRSVLGTITHVETAQPVAALTFDDGPDPVGTPLVLDLLDRHGAKATFFVLGKHAALYPELIKRIADSGHTIANHSFDHPRFPSLRHRDRVAQMKAWEAVTAPYGAKLFRPPRGLQSVRSRIDAFLLGYKVVTWNVVVLDWEPRDPAWTLERLEGQVKPGSIVLLHDTLCEVDYPEARDRQPMLAALDAFLTRNQAGLTYVTVPKLLEHGTPHRASWFVRSDADWSSHDPS
jgi:peptidoglycan/xylan/chitin deacetylase (PgdA/CDA1 family)